MTLFLCYTPLHALIAMRIVEQEEISAYAVIYLCYSKSRKHRKYFELLAKNSDEAHFCELDSNFLSDLYKLVSLARNIRPQLGKSIFFGAGNIKDFNSRFLMMLLGVRRFFTFDDGSGNICGQGYFYEQSERLRKTVLFRLFAPRLLYPSLSKSGETHYTIYRFRNVFSPTKYVSLLPHEARYSEKGNSESRIYLANAFSEDGLMSVEEEIELDCEIISRFEISNVLLHPRSNVKDHFSQRGVEIVDTDLIAEDYALRRLNHGPVTLVGVYSSALLNLADIEGISLVNVNADIGKPSAQIGSLMRKVGIRCVPLD